MIELHPNLSNIYSCPLCRGPVELKGFIINGVRNLADMTCPACRRSFYHDMPAGHGLFYPFTIDQETLEVFQPLNHFGQALIENCANKHSEDVKLTVHRYSERSEIVLLNCLDTCWGHGLHRLNNAQYHIDHQPELGCCVLVPKNLTHMVPEGVAEIWEVDLPLHEYRYWHTSIDQKVRAEVAKKTKVYLSPAYPKPPDRAFSFRRFVTVGPGDFSHLGRPIIVYCFRSDRTWGAAERQQRSNIIRLHRLLRKAYPQMTFALIGFGKSLKFPPEIMDKRVESFDPEMERFWLALLQNTDCAVGVHGSNMQVASGLAQCAVELLPESHYHNAFQPYMLKDGNADPYENLFRFRVLYGNEVLTDISPPHVARVMVSQLAGLERHRTVRNVFQPSRDCQPGSDLRLVLEAHAKHRYLTDLRAISRIERYSAFLRRVARRARGHLYW